MAQERCYYHAAYVAIGENSKPGPRAAGRPRGKTVCERDAVCHEDARPSMGFVTWQRARGGPHGRAQILRRQKKAAQDDNRKPHHYFYEGSVMTRLIRPAALLFIAISILPAAADSAKSLYNRGKDAEQRQDYEKAYEYYKQAYDQKPKDLQFRAAFERMRFLAGASRVHRG